MRTQIAIVTFLCLSGFVCRCEGVDSAPERTKVYLPTGKYISPLASPASHLDVLDPHIAEAPGFLAGQAISCVLSPDKQTLLVLTSGFNRLNGADGKRLASASNEYIFVYDVSKARPRQLQAVEVPNSFQGIAFFPDGSRFAVSGGVDDNVHVFARGRQGKWQETGEAVPLHHRSGLGLTPEKEPLAAAGAAVTADGMLVLVANLYNDSVSFVDVRARKLVGELDLRPGRISIRESGVPGGEYPIGIVTGRAGDVYVSSLRDREIVHLEIAHLAATGRARVVSRIKVDGNPGKMILNRAQDRLLVVCDNSDQVVVINTKTDQVETRIAMAMPQFNLTRWTGSGPNDLVLSPDEHSLYVTNGGTNAVAVVKTEGSAAAWQVDGYLPTGWFPTGVQIAGNGSTLYVTNAKTAAGPNPHLHATLANLQKTVPGPNVLAAQNQYVYQLEKGGLLTIPLPNEAVLRHLTSVVAEDNGWTAKAEERDETVMAALHERVKHVIYIIKENRTYDQILGDLGQGNGDPSLAEFGQAITPNFHAMAREFVNLDNFYNSGEVSGDGWPWSTSGRESDFGEKAVPLNYSNRGTNYEYEGLNRDINVALPDAKSRRKANPKTPDDPDLLPGTANVAEPDGPTGTPKGKGYIWDAVLRKGLTFREYGCMSDTNLDSPRDPTPFAHKVTMSIPSNPELLEYGDPYYRGFDPGYPDFYREAEWEREFAAYEAAGNLPAFEIVQLPVDHMGDFQTALSRVNTPEAQQADNDYATAKLITRIAHSRYASDTLVFVVEDDAQDGPDHVDAHRSTAYAVGPYVKHAATISENYTTVSVIRTIEDVLGLDHLNLNTATSRPMTEVFDLGQTTWTFQAHPSAVLAKTDLPLSAAERAEAEHNAEVRVAHDSHYWAEKTAGWNFRREDQVDAEAFNRVIWQGLMKRAYPSGRN